MGCIRLARFNQAKPLVVNFFGAYHGWWDGPLNLVGSGAPPPAAASYKCTLQSEHCPSRGSKCAERLDVSRPGGRRPAHAQVGLGRIAGGAAVSETTP